MPAAKPKALIQRHDTKAEQQARADKEAAFDTGFELPKREPAELKGHDTAAKTWRRLMREFSAIEDSYVVSLDRDMLINYCILVEQLEELDRMRKTSYRIWLHYGKNYEKAVKEDNEDSAEEWALKAGNAFDDVVKLDARADQKRKAIFDLQKSLYMTPRSRAGAKPPKKEDDGPTDEMDELLGNSVNGNGK